MHPHDTQSAKAGRLPGKSALKRSLSVAAGFSLRSKFNANMIWRQIISQSQAKACGYLKGCCRTASANRGVMRQGGFSLIEMIVLIVLTAIIFPAILLPFVEGVREIDLPVVRGTMALLAQEEMETNIIPYEYQGINEWSSQAISGFPDYESSCDIICVSDGAFNIETTGDSGYKRVTVTVTHGEESLSLITIKTDWTEQS